MSFLALAALSLACGPKRGAAPAPPDATYTLRGEIVRLPAAAGGELSFHHEAVPGFRDAQGRVVGMASMTMPFATAPELDLSDLAVGDRVELDFEVRWNGRGAPLRVVRIVRLAPGTRLGFDPPAQSGGETPR